MALAVRFFLVLAVMLVAGKVSGELCERFRQPAVLGELIVGMLLGASVFHVIPTSPTDPLTPVLQLLAAVGVVVLLFEIGLASELKAMMRVGPAATVVAAVGVTATLLLGVLYWLSPLHRAEPSSAGAGVTAVFVGATLAATSAGITARVLADLACTQTLEARLILGAAIIDDVLALVILGVVSSLVEGRAHSAMSAVGSVVIAIGFLIGAIAAGLALAPRIFALIERMRVRGVLVVSAFAFLLVLAALADRVGSALIVGAFAAGIILSGTEQARTIEEQMKPVADIFVPLFFLSIGAAIDPRIFDPRKPGHAGVLAMGGALILIAVLGKLAAGWAVPWRRINHWAVGFGMLPRGEVSLVVANVGLGAGVLSLDVLSAVFLTIIGTTLVAPPLVTWAFGRWGATLDQRA